MEEETEIEFVTKPENALCHFLVMRCIFPPIFIQLSIAAYTLEFFSHCAHFYKRTEPSSHLRLLLSESEADPHLRDST